MGVLGIMLVRYDKVPDKQLTGRRLAWGDSVKVECIVVAGCY